MTDRVRDGGFPDDAAMDAFLARLGSLAPEARDVVVARMWDGRRSREQLELATMELRALMQHPHRGAFDAVTWPTAMALGEDGIITPPWIGPATRRVLYALRYDGVAVAGGWSSQSVLMGAAAVYHRAALSRQSLGVLYYPFEPAVPLASLDAEIGTPPDPTAPAAAPPPPVPPAAVAKVERMLDFLHNAPGDALADAVEELTGEFGLALAAGSGAPAAAGNRLREALARAGLTDEANAQAERVVTALRARHDDWRLPDTDPASPPVHDGGELVTLLTWASAAIRATIAGESLDDKAKGLLVHPFWTHVEQHEREVREGRRPAVRPRTRPPRRLDAPAAARVETTPDAVVMVLGVRLDGRELHLLVESRLMGIPRGFMRAADGSLPAFTAVEDARAHLREFFPPRGLPRDLVRTLEGVGDPIDLDRVRAMPETGWEREWRLDEVEEVWAILAYAGELPALAVDGPVTGLAARLRETRVAYDEARRPKPRPKPQGERGALFVREAPAAEPPPPPSPWAVGATTWSAEDLAALRRTLQQRVDDFAARIRVVAEA